MNLSFRYTVLFLGLIGILILTGCSTNTKSFSTVESALAQNINQLRNKPGITQTGFASDRGKKVLKVGIRIDHQLITGKEVKQAVEAYLQSAAYAANEPEFKNLLKPYEFRLEEIDQKNNTRIIAVKTKGSTEIIWKEEIAPK